MYNKVSGSSVAFIILYVDDILLIRNDIEFLDSIEGFVHPKGANKVCKLQRSIYGLVQASRSWIYALMR